MTAKETFIASGDAQSFSEMVANPVFQRAMQYALLHFVESQSRVPNPLEYDSASALQGALKFRDMLENLPKPAETPQPFKDPFNYDAYERQRRNHT